MSAAGDAATLFREWARGAKGTAAQNKARRDWYGAQLAEARSRVYSDAADLVESHDTIADAVAVMLDRAGQMQVMTPPLTGFEPAGLRYITARAFQHCATHLDPGAPVVQQPWP